jgi:hypothetical protein
MAHLFHFRAQSAIELWYDRETATTTSAKYSRSGWIPPGKSPFLSELISERELMDSARWVVRRPWIGLR